MSLLLFCQKKKDHVILTLNVEQSFKSSLFLRLQRLQVFPEIYRDYQYFLKTDAEK